LQRATGTIFQVSCLIAFFPAQAEEIDEILVTAVRRAVVEEQLSVALDMLDSKDVQQHTLLTDALADATGVHLQQTTPGQGAAIVRGQKGSAVLHLVDGMRLNNAIFRSAPTQYFALVPTVAVERIEILRGTPASLYGSDAIGGVLQVITHKPKFESASVSSRGEVFASANTAERSRVLGGTLDVGTNRLATSLSVEFADIGDRRIGGGDRIKPSGYESRAARWLVAGTPAADKSWSLDLQFLEQPDTPRVDELVAGFGQIEPSSSEFFFKPNRRSFVHGDYQSSSGLLGLDWDADVAWQRIDDDRQTRDYLASDRILERNRSDLYGLTISGSKRTDRGSWIAGVDIHHDEVSSRRVSEDIVAGQRSDVAPRFPDGSSMQLLSTYGNGTWTIGERHAVTAGLRLSDVRTRLPSSQVHNTEISGDIGWVVKINELWQFTSNLGYGFRAPNVFDLGTLGNRPGNRFNIPNADLESERVVHADIGVRYRMGGNEFEVSAYTMRYRDRITSVSTGGVTPSGRDITQSVNAATSYVHGIEVSSRVEVGMSWLLDGNLTYTRGEQQIAGMGTQPADRIPPLSGRLGLTFDPGSSYTIEAWASFSADQSRLSNRDIRDSRINPEGTPGWASFGARATWEPIAEWTLALTFSNMLDAGYRVHGSGIDAIGQNLTLSARWRW
jgi:outer membrane receptor protein involved in Fe transport